VGSSNLAVGHPELVICGVARISRICIPRLLVMDLLRRMRVSGETEMLPIHSKSQGEIVESLLFLHASDDDDGIHRQNITSLRDYFILPSVVGPARI
jgi:hypothetical protein